MMQLSISNIAWKKEQDEENLPLYAGKRFYWAWKLRLQEFFRNCLMSI